MLGPGRGQPLRGRGEQPAGLSVDDERIGTDPSLVDARTNERRRVAHEAVPLGDTQPEVPVLARRVAGVEAADLRDDGPPQHDRHRVDHVAAQQRPQKVARDDGRPARPRPLAALEELRHVRVRDGCIRVSVEQRDLRGQFAGQPDVVAVEERHEIADGGFERTVARGCRTRVLLPQDADAVAEGAQHGGRLVRRAVVHDEDLVAAGALLGEGRLKRLADELRPVEDWHDDGHPNGHRREASSLSPRAGSSTRCPGAGATLPRWRRDGCWLSVSTRPTSM